MKLLSLDTRFLEGKPTNGDKCKDATIHGHCPEYGLEREARSRHSTGFTLLTHDPTGWETRGLRSLPI